MDLDLDLTDCTFKSKSDSNDSLIDRLEKARKLLTGSVMSVLVLAALAAYIVRFYSD